MQLKDELFKRQEQTWVILTHKPKKSGFTKLIGAIDLFNHQHMSRSFKDKKISFQLGEKSLFSSQNILPAKRMIVIGLGAHDESENPKASASMLIKQIETVLEDLHDEKPFIAISENAPQELIDAVKKKSFNYLVG